MDTLPRFRFPDESSSHDVSAAAARSGAWSDFDDLDSLETRVQEKSAESTSEFEAMPTRVHPRHGRLVREPLRAVKAKEANVDDVVEELRAAAAGRKPRVRELQSTDLLEEIPDADEAQVVDVSELVFDRAVARRDVWNVHKAARPAQLTLHGPTKSNNRFILTAALAMAFGALLAVAAAFAIWHLSGLRL
jgi:hypothetical protein